MPQVTVVSATRTWVANIVSCAVTTIVPIGSVRARRRILAGRVKVLGGLPGERSCLLSLVWAVLEPCQPGLARVVMTRAGVRLPQNLRGRLLHRHGSRRWSRAGEGGSSLIRRADPPLGSPRNSRVVCPDA
jgi:hypothetical protein